VAGAFAAGARMRALMRWMLAIFYAGAGLLHIFAPDGFLPIIPDFVPFPRAVVIVTGFCEVAGAVALIGVRLRRLAGLMLALYAICVVPANIKHAFAGVHVPGLPDSWWYHGPRLALQPVLVWCGRSSHPAASAGRFRRRASRPPTTIRAAARRPGNSRCGGPAPWAAPRPGFAPPVAPRIPGVPFPVSTEHKCDMVQL